MSIGFSEEVKRAVPELLAERRYLHENAEVSFKEYKTTEWLFNALSPLPGVTIERPTKTGLVAHVFGTKPGEAHVVGIRADIDALPMTEETPVPFASKNPGAMHACGHDGHAAILLETVKALSADRESFCGEVRCFFQRADLVWDVETVFDVRPMNCFGGKGAALSGSVYLESPGEREIRLTKEAKQRKAAKKGVK